MNAKQLTIVVVAVVGLLLVSIFGSRIIEVVDGGEIHVKQGALSGEITMYSTEGPYGQWFGKITKYLRTAETYLSSDDNDGGAGTTQQAVKVRFGDGGTAHISSTTQWRLPLGDENLLKIHRNFRNMTSLQAQARQWIIEVEKQTASTFKADETYSTRRGDLQALMSEQIANGLYATEVIAIEVPTAEQDSSGVTIMSTVNIVRVKKDSSGLPIIVKPGIFKEYALELVNHSLKDIDYDATIESLISQKKQAEQAKAVAITNAEKAIQDAITVEAQGDARIAQAKADEEVAKITAVTQAEKQAEVQTINAQALVVVAQANLETEELNAEANLVAQRAQAEANRLKVRAGLTPQEQMEWEYKIADVTTKNMWGPGIGAMVLPKVMTGGGSNGGGVLDMIGINQALDIAEKVSAQSVQ